MSTLFFWYDFFLVHAYEHPLLDILVANLNQKLNLVHIEQGSGNYGAWTKSELQPAL